MHLGPAKLERYELRAVLARSATGAVYEGWDTRIARKVAIKTVSLNDGDSLELDDKLERFKREAQAAGQLQHPNIVAVYDYGETDSLAYIVMEMVDGPTLKALFEQNNRLELPQIVAIMDDVLAALQYSHERGVIHRDVKPANVMITGSGRAKLTDFGIARIDRSSMTHVGTVMGTPAYMSPEQFLGEVVDQRTDIYSAGVVLYQMLTGERPFEGSAATIMHRALNVDPTKPSELSSQISPVFDSIVARAMAKKRDDRFPDAATFAERIRAAAEPTILLRAPRERPVAAQARAVRPAAPVRRRGSGNIIAAVATGIIALAGIGGGAFWYQSLENHTREVQALATATAGSQLPPQPTPSPAVPPLAQPVPPVPQPTERPAESAAPPTDKSAGDKSPLTAPDNSVALAPKPDADAPAIANDHGRSNSDTDAANTATEQAQPRAAVPPELLPPTAVVPTQRYGSNAGRARSQETTAAEPLVALMLTRWWPGAVHTGCSPPKVSGLWQRGASAEIVVDDGPGCGATLWTSWPRRTQFKSLLLSGPPAHGVVRIEGSRFVYQPEHGFAGRDRFIISGTPPGSLTVNVTVPSSEAAPRAPEAPAREEEQSPASVPHGSIGATLAAVTDDMAQRLGLRGAEGVMVENVDRDGPASQARLQPMDIILAFNSSVVRSASELARIIQATPPGTAVPVEVWHDHQLITVQLVTAQAPN